jgi:hypothetical protein
MARKGAKQTKVHVSAYAVYLRELTLLIDWQMAVEIDFLPTKKREYERDVAAAHQETDITKWLNGLSQANCRLK